MCASVGVDALINSGQRNESLGAIGASTSGIFLLASMFEILGNTRLIACSALPPKVTC